MDKMGNRIDWSHDWTTLDSKYQNISLHNGNINNIITVSTQRSRRANWMTTRASTTSRIGWLCEQ
jgi:hypothetical protein